MMEFQVFTMEMLACLKKSVGEQVTLRLHAVRKNNGVELTGISFEEKGKNAAPTIYLNEFYHYYYQKGMSLQEVADMVQQVFEESRLEGSVDMSDFWEYEKARKHIFVRVINYEKNKELLEKVPHKVRHQLAFVCYYFVNQKPFAQNGYIQIDQSHVEKWGVSFEEVYQNAMEHTIEMLPAKMEPAENVLERSGEKQSGKPGDFGMYILTNELKLLGAVCMFYPGLLKEIADQKGSNLFILPSSIHEVILLPQKDDMKPLELLRLVTKVNSFNLPKSEFLADVVYYYDREKDEFTVFS